MSVPLSFPRGGTKNRADGMVRSTEEKMSEIDWRRYPLASAGDLSRRWLQIQRDLGLAQNTVEAYGRGLEEYLGLISAKGLRPAEVGRESIAGYVRVLSSRSVAPRGRGISLGRKSTLSNATLQLRLTVVRLFYDFLVEEGLYPQNPVGRGRYTPGKAFGSGKDRGLVRRYRTLPWIPSEDDWKAILGIVQKKSLRVRLMFALSYDGDLRREELCSIQVADIDP